MRLPDLLLQHTITVEPYAGAGATGDTYDDPVEVATFVDRRRRVVKAADGTEVVSETTVYTQLDALAAVPGRSRITLPAGEQTKVIDARRRDGGGLATPDHWELVCE